MASIKRQNWGKYETWYPQEIYYPTSLQELQQAIKDAKEKKKHIRLAGALHSMNQLSATSEVQIQMDKLSRVLSIDRQGLKVKVQSGIIIKELLEVLAKNGLSLPNQGYIIEQSISGAIATATHGSGKTGTFSSFVEEMELVDSEGEVHVLSPFSKPELFSAAVTNLGCLGVVYTLTLRCIPLDKLHLSKVRSDLQTTLDQLPQLLEKDYFQFAIDPYSDAVIRWEYNVTQEALKNRWGFYFKWLVVRSLAFFSFDVISTPSWMMPLSIKIYIEASQLKSCVDYSYKLLSPADEGHYIEEEIAVPLESFKEALAETRQILDRRRKQKQCLVGIILIRFCSPDEYGELSPAHHRQTAYISLITFANKGYRELFHEFEAALYKYQGRPHWGKYNSLTKEKILELYGNDYKKFMQAKQTLDPKGLFLNEYVEKFFT